MGTRCGPVAQIVTERQTPGSARVRACEGFLPAEFSAGNGSARVRACEAGEHYETFVVQNPNGTESDALQMSRDQCLYVLMRESKAVRRAVTVKLNRAAVPAELSRLGTELAVRIRGREEPAVVVKRPFYRRG